MAKRKSFWSILFALCLLVLPSMFLLSACGNSNPEKKENAITINVSSKIYDGQAINVVATSTSGVEVAWQNEDIYFDQVEDNNYLGFIAYVDDAQVSKISIDANYGSVRWTIEFSIAYENETI